MKQLLKLLFTPKSKTLGDYVRENNRLISQREKEQTKDEIIQHLQNCIRGHKSAFTKLKKSL